VRNAQNAFNEASFVYSVGIEMHTWEAPRWVTITNVVNSPIDNIRELFKIYVMVAGKYQTL